MATDNRLQEPLLYCDAEAYILKNLLPSVPDGDIKHLLTKAASYLKIQSGCRLDRSLDGLLQTADFSQQRRVSRTVASSVSFR